MARTILGLLKKIQNRYKSTRSFAVTYAIQKGTYIKPAYITQKRVRLHQQMNGTGSLKVSDDEIILFWSVGNNSSAHKSVIQSTVNHRRKLLGLPSVSVRGGRISSQEKAKMIKCLYGLRKTECPENILKIAGENISNLTVE